MTDLNLEELKQAAEEAQPFMLHGGGMEPACVSISAGQVLALIARIEWLEKRWEDRKLKGRRDGRKTLIEEMESTPEGRERMRNARYDIAYERVEGLHASIQRVRDLHWETLGECAACSLDSSTPHPCPTIQALEGDPK
ncbi:hypothetical protein [Timonella senegalensis]|uniref:hypothetical protein n=1 Tax=Timonella senegalensis TaxID=1465825 RepID=UPI0003090C73|nr:hypothetical protein [Timonella senegalensis]